MPKIPEHFIFDTPIFREENTKINYRELHQQFKMDMAVIEESMTKLIAEQPGVVEKVAPSGPPGTVARYHAQMESLVFYPRQSGKEGYECANQGPGELPFQNIQTLLAGFFIRSYIDHRIRNWRNFCIGITNYTSNHSVPTLYMPMFDYDGKNIKTQIRADVKKLQEDFKLGDAWVYHTKRGFHVYFFTDLVDWHTFTGMLNHVSCCDGFKRSTTRNGFATLRVSAKYTKFDIGFEYVLKAAKPEKAKRILQKGYVVQELIRLGQECDTHFAALFPQWAHFAEDRGDWRPGKSKSVPSRYQPRRRSSPVKMVSAGEYEKFIKKGLSPADIQQISLKRQKEYINKKASFKASYATDQVQAVSIDTTTANTYYYKDNIRYNK